jgi:hypothetical protein
LFGLLALLLPLVKRVAAQELREEATPFSVWLDFNRPAAKRWPHTGLPSWMESVTAQAATADDGTPQTIYLLRFREIRVLNKDMQLRLFFDDQKSAQPKISGWSETGTLRFERGPLGAGLGLPTSESLTFSTAGVDFVEITVAGDGSNIRGVFLAMLKTQEMQRALDFAPPSAQIDAFGNAAPAVPRTDDLALFGRVRATIDPGVLKLTPAAFNGTWEFALEAPPLVAMVTFEALDAEALAPLEVIVNGRSLGPATVQMPDLADPGYLGLVRPLESDMRFRYTGWLRCQKVIPGSVLKAGGNEITGQSPDGVGPCYSNRQLSAQNPE